MSTFFISLTTVIGLLSNQSQMIGFWVSGGFRNASWADFKLIFVVGIIGLIIAILLSPKINILNLGDDVAIGLGENPEKIRFITLMVMIPMCAAAVAVGKNIAFYNLSYDKAPFEDNCVIYCDIPYKGTTKYKTDFNHDKFYEWCRKVKKENDKLGNNVIIYVSEYNMPEDFKCVWKKEIKMTRDKNSNSKKAVEKLFKLK